MPRSRTTTFTLALLAVAVLGPAASLLAEDCNNNGIDDADEIAAGTSLDCNANGTPDECEIANNDCNGNDVPDECDIASGFSEDCNRNGEPDECDLDNGTSLDCNANDVPDECDLATDASHDCNHNAVPDECDIAGEASEDCNHNAIPDECDVLPVNFALPETIDPGRLPRSVVVADLDRDGRLDLVVGNVGNEERNVAILFGNGDGSFAPRTIVSTVDAPDYVRAADVNGDARLDLISSNSAAGTVAVLLQQEDRVFGPAVVYAGQTRDAGLVIADLDGDGSPDIATAWMIRWNDGAGTFERTTSLPDEIRIGAPVAAGDLDGDGRSDLIVMSGGRGPVVFALFNRGDGLFDLPRTIAPSSRVPLLRDMNDDMQLDLVLTTGNEVRVLLNRGEGEFVEHTRSTIEAGITSLNAGDFNADGALDLVLTTHSDDVVRVLVNRGDSTFTRPYAFPAGVDPFAPAVGDLDGDGIVDLVVVNALDDGELSVVLNEGIPLASLDCNSNIVPDECEADCNTNAVSDECDIASGFSLDCNGNGVPDDCDVGIGAVPDENRNGIPDECETLGDMDGDWDVDLADLVVVQSCMRGSGQPVEGDCVAADLDGDGDGDLADFLIWQAKYTGPLHTQTLVLRVDASANDAEEALSDGRITVTSSDLELGAVRGGPRLQQVGVRFTGLEIPRGARILEAIVQFTVDEADEEATSVWIRGELSPDAAAFSTTNADITTRPRTEALVGWNLIPAWTAPGEAGPDQETPNLAPIVQEIVDQTNWSPTNALVVILEPNPGGERTAESFDGSPSQAPLLRVTFLGGLQGDEFGPVADAGPDREAAGDTFPRLVSLDGSASLPSDAPIQTYEWFRGDELLGEGVTLDVPLEIGIHVFTLRVTDTRGISDVDTVTIEVKEGGRRR